jgi:transposase-like protein
MSRLPEEKREQIIAALKANPNAAQVARQVGGVSQVSVWWIAKKASIELTASKPTSGNRLSEDQREEIIAALKANPNAAQVARQVGGISHVTVWKIAKKAGIELVARSRPHRNDDQHLVGRAANGDAPNIA